MGVESGEVQNIYSLPQGAALGHQAGERVTWTKDGRSILFAVNKNGISNIWAQTDGSSGANAATAAADHEFFIRYDLVVCVVSRRKRIDFRPRPPHQRHRSDLAFPLSIEPFTHSRVIPNEVRDLHFVQHSRAAAFIPSLLLPRESWATP